MTGDGLAVGASAPEFTAPLVRPDGNVVETSLSELLADGPVLLSFYTVDFSPDCIEEWCSFRDFDWFASGDTVQVVGVSKSGTRLHKQFIDRLDLSFPLFSDRDLAVADAFDVVYRFLKLSKRSRRSCFLVDTDGVVRYRWVGDHWLDPSRDTPPVGEIHDAVVAELGADEPDTFGF
ncbi:Peroxiredoxin [Halopelagius inordinatus]|uniref:thioredoxin-dependent peroxiredoxin n=1 Tax=Halopelagius inordinatus TaxID=553467 RepID=A0A1I2MC38_9EURY|nr:redoxin domain-containing protein [Halopelagius inordinatus]SFF88490.1 Peroxiredoxin [Halopelagius inordinatus]